VKLGYTRADAAPHRPSSRQSITLTTRHRGVDSHVLASEAERVAGGARRRASASVMDMLIL
jgi:hypothetical protein